MKNDGHFARFLQRLSTEQQLLIRLGERISPFGFKPKPTGQSFYQVVATGKWAFHLSFIPHKTDFDLTADIAVRLNAIEDLVNEYDTKLGATEKRKSMTLGGELGNISGGIQNVGPSPMSRTLLGFATG